MTNVNTLAEHFLFSSDYDETTGKFTKLAEISIQRKDGTRFMREATAAETKLYRTVHLRRAGLGTA